ncbi:CBS domain-containing protein [Paenibacillus sp. 1P07SE]|uniref:CBS domain-containing protein n=1 Tax=Paenibacillus sp. 1P07SE TaxID=3132209 RepID=UPI0039A71571
MRTISDIMSKDCVTCSTNSTIQEVAQLMKSHDIGFIPVTEQSRLIGVITDRDLVIRCCADNHAPDTAIANFVSKDIRTAEPGMSVEEAASIMASEQIRRLPIVENGHLLGVVALGDLAVREIFINEAGQALNEISEHHGSSIH